MTTVKIKARIYKDEDAGAPWSWFFTVDAYVGDDPEPCVIDYGSVTTHAEALRIVEYVLTHRDEYDNAHLIGPVEVTS